jgi:glutaconate CoA-transferase subunit A
MAFAGHTATHDFQILCAGEVFNKLDAAYIVGLEASGAVPPCETLHGERQGRGLGMDQLCLFVRFKAAAAGVSFISGEKTSWARTTFKYSGAKMITCPFTGATYVALPAIYPDVAAIHVHESDIYGNCRVRGITRSDADLARASKRLIITCERLISNDEIRRNPNERLSPIGWSMRSVKSPIGSYPATCTGNISQTRTIFASG